ncbi:MAG: PQQ-binding-like beta-propeller repeat protein [Phycisphaerales bacterium]
MRLAIFSLLVTSAAFAQPDDWTNMGGNAQRNGLAETLGPVASDDILWENGPSSIIAWPPFIQGASLITVRQTGFPPSGEPNGSPVYILDLYSGATQRTINVPFNTGDWTTWVAGARDGRVFASRSGNGASVSAKMYAYNIATGSEVWQSQVVQNAGAYDGVVFAPDGDLIVASFRNIWRIDFDTGATVWTASRLCSVSGNCGGALSPSGDAVYVADAVPGGHAIKKFRLSDGAFQYQSAVMSGFTLQNTPLVAPNGDIFLSRTQNNTATDFVYAFQDTGAAIVQKWSKPAAWSTESSLACGSDSSLYAFAPGNLLRRLSNQTGDTMAEALPIPADFFQPQIAVDAEGRVYVSNGAFSNGRLYCFSDSLELLWSKAVTNVNVGGPAIGDESGILVMTGNGNQLFAMNHVPSGPVCNDIDFNNDGSAFDPQDIEALLSVYSEGPCIPATATCDDLDFNNDTSIFDPCDINSFLLVYSEGPCTLCGV